MRILVVQESDWLTKGPHQQHHLMDRLSLRSHEIRVIDFEIAWKAQRNYNLFSMRKTFTGVSKVHEEAAVTVIRPSIIKIPFLDMGSLIFSHGKEILHQIAEFKPDIIVGFGILNNYLAMQLAKRLNIPFVYYLLDELDTLVPYKSFQFLAKALMCTILRDADSVVVINEQLRDTVIRLGADPRRTYTVRAGIDSHNFNPNGDRATIRKQYGIKMTDLVLFFMGTVFDFSGIKEVALDLAKIKKQNPNIKLLIAGQIRTPELQKELDEIRETFDLHDHFIFAGRQPYYKIPLFLGAADICLLPAYVNEVMCNVVPIKMYEYLASGKPVISTKLPGIIREFGYYSGVIYVDRPNSVIKKVVELLSKRENLAKIGFRASSIAGRYSWNKITEEFEKILEKTIENAFN
ncbi:MAG: glycosyltransferase family 4 protein [Promethearchaeota archaeon]